MKNSTNLIARKTEMAVICVATEDAEWALRKFVKPNTTRAMIERMQSKSMADSLAENIARDLWHRHGLLDGTVECSETQIAAAIRHALT